MNAMICELNTSSTTITLNRSVLYRGVNLFYNKQYKLNIVSTILVITLYVLNHFAIPLSLQIIQNPIWFAINYIHAFLSLHLNILKTFLTKVLTINDEYRPLKVNDYVMLLS